MKTTSPRHMSQGNKKPRVSRFRLWAGLCIWSLLLAMAYVVWQTQDNAYWTSGWDGKTTMKAIMIAIICAYLFFFVLSYGIVRAWRNLPASRKMRFWFVAASITLGILWCSFLFWQRVCAGQIYPLAQALLLVLFWSVVFLTGLLFAYSLRHFFRWLFSWRILKRALLALGLFVVLFALFYVEENRRGRRDWNAYRQALENNGEKLTLAAFAPPSVPDEQNFAMAPILFTSYSNNLVYRNSLKQPTAFSISNRLEMNLDRTNLNYGTNRIIGSWQKAVLTDLLPWQDYYRTRFITNEMMSEPPPWPGSITEAPRDTNTNNNVAVPLDTTEFPIAAQPQSPAADVLLALSRYNQTLDELQQAGERPYSRFPIAYTNDNPTDILLPHLKCVKSPAIVLQLRAIAELQADQTEAALRDIKLMLRLADSLRSEPFLISQLVRIALINLSLQPVWEGLAEQRWSDSELKTLITEFQKINLVSDLEFTLHGERAAMLGDIEYFKSHRSESAGFLLLAICPRFLEKADELSRFAPNLPNPVSEFLDGLSRLIPAEALGHGLEKLPPAGWYDLNKVSIAREFQTNLFALADPSKHLISQMASTNSSIAIERDYEFRNVKPGNVLLRLLLPTMTVTSQRFAQGQSAVDMAILAGALERYRLAHGKFPATLDALTPEFLENIPPDVVNGEPLHYQLTSNGSFKLYSIGWNGNDDGGVIGTNQFGRYNPKSGDWVWQYPAKP